MSMRMVKARLRARAGSNLLFSLSINFLVRGKGIPYDGNSGEATMSNNSVWADEKARQLEGQAQDQKLKDKLSVIQHERIRRDTPRLWNDLRNDVSDKAQHLNRRMGRIVLAFNEEAGHSFSIRNIEKNTELVVRLKDSGVELCSERVDEYVVVLDNNQTYFAPRKPSNYFYKQRFSAEQLAEIITDIVMP
jgi:hypothetical protein